MNNKLVVLREMLGGMVDYHVRSKYQTIPPKEMIVNLTYRCNSKCIMCNIWKINPKNEMDLASWKRWVDDPIFEKVERLTISGGEPMLNGEFGEIAKLFLKKIKNLKYLSVISNGFLTDVILKKTKALAIEAKKRSVGFGISISLDGVGDVHEKVRRIEKGFEKTSKTILELQKLTREINFDVNVGSLVLRQNLGEFKRTEKWLKDHNIDHGFQVVGFHETFVDNLKEENEVNYLPEQRKDLLKLLRYLRDQKDVDKVRSYYWNDLIGMYFERKRRTTPCPFLVDQCVIDGQGNVYYCLSEPAIGNFIKEKRRIIDIYKDKKNVLRRRRMWNSCCRKCNSGCNTDSALKSDVFKLLMFKLGVGRNDG